MDPNLLLAIITLCAIFSPMITCIIDNYYKDKSEKTKFYELSKRDALSDYIKSVYTYKNGINVDDLTEYQFHSNNLYVYFHNIPENLQSLNPREDTKFDIQFQNAIINLSKQIKKR